MRVLRDSDYKFTGFDDERQMFIFEEVRGSGVLLTPQAKFVIVENNAVLVFNNNYSQLVDYTAMTKKKIEAGEILAIPLPQISRQIAE